MASHTIHFLVIGDQAGFEGIAALITAALVLLFVLSLLFIYSIYRRPLDKDYELSPLPGSDGLFLQDDPPSTQPPNEYCLPLSMNFSGQGDTFIFGPSADTAAEMILEVLTTQKRWLGVSQKRLVAYCKQEGALTEAVEHGANDLSSMSMLRRETYRGEFVYFVTEKMLTEIDQTP